MYKMVYRRLAGLTAVLVLLAAFMTAVPAEAATFIDSGFEATWNRVDKAVQDLPNSGRGYTWGPPAPNTAAITTETYNSATRKIEYFDKARMEINNPGGNPNDLFYITTGLLVKELVTGNRQDGDSTFTALPPSQVQVAGDTNEGGTNSLAPTYASFRFVGTFFQKENSISKMAGQPITAQMAKSGAVTTFTPPEQRLLKGYDDVTGHNIADVFEDYGNLSGPIWDGSKFVNGSVFFGLPLYVFGRPVTEPYWVRTAVNNVEQDVLVQLFERRVLTYTAKNPDGFKVEMGNVGQHYYRWRYELNAVPATAPTKAELVSEFGQDKSAIKTTGPIAADGAGNYYLAYGSQIFKYDGQGNRVATLGQPEPSSDPGKFTGITGLDVDGDSNLYVAESGNHRVQKFDPQGHNTALWTVPKRDPTNDFYPRAISVDTKGNVSILDNVGVIRFDNQGSVLSQWSHPGKTANQLTLPQTLAVDAAGNTYIHDLVPEGYFYPTSYIKKYDAQGNFLLKWVSGDIYKDSINLDSQGNVLVNLDKFDPTGKKLGDLTANIPQGEDYPNIYYVTISPDDNVYISGGYNSLVTKLDLSGKLLANFSTYGRSDGNLREPYSAVTDGDGNLYVYDGRNYRIQKFDQHGKFLLKWGSLGSGDGQFADKKAKLAVDDQGNIYVADPGRTQIQKFDGQGHLLLKIGQTTETSPCQGKLAAINDVTVDSYGYIYVATGENTTNCIQKFDQTGKFVLQWNVFPQVDKPLNIAADRQGHLFIVDSKNNKVSVYDTSGRFSRAVSTDATGANEGGDYFQLTLDSQGNIYTLNTATSRVTKYNSQGTQLFSWGIQGYESGQFYFPHGLAVDGQGNVYVIDTGNDRIEKYKQG